MVFKLKKGLKKLRFRKRSKKTEEIAQEENYADLCLEACVTVGQNVFEDCLLIVESIREQCSLMNEHVREKRMVETANESFMIMGDIVDRSLTKMGENVREISVMISKYASLHGTCMMIGENVHERVEKLVGGNGHEIDLTETSTDGENADTASIHKIRRTPVEQIDEEITACSSDTSQMKEMVALDAPTVSPDASSISTRSIDSTSGSTEAIPTTSRRDLRSIGGSDSKTVSLDLSDVNRSSLTATDAPTISRAPSSTSKRDPTSLVGSHYSTVPSARSDANGSRFIDTDARTISPATSAVSMRKIDSTAPTSISPAPCATRRSDVKHNVTEDIGTFRQITPNTSRLLVEKILVPSDNFDPVGDENKAESIAEVTRNQIQISMNFENKKTDEDIDFFHNTCMNIRPRMHFFFDGTLCKGKADTLGVVVHDKNEKVDQQKQPDTETYHSPYLVEI